MQRRQPHWSERYLGRPWVPVAHNCTDFAATVLREQFALHLRLPGQPDGPPRATTVRSRDDLARALVGDIARPLWGRERLREGDAVLMRGRAGLA